MVQLLDIPDVAVRLKVSARSVEKLIEKGELVAITAAGARRVHPDDLAAYLEARRKAAGAAVQDREGA